MAIDFSSLQATPVHSGQIDFSAIGGIPVVGQDEAADDTSAVGAAGRGAAGMIPLGEQTYAGAAGLAENKPYLKERQELEQEIAADKANHPIARLAGQAAGVMAPALVTGGASAPESLAAAAGEGALVGGGFGAGNAIDTLASGGSGAKAAGDVALGVGLGAAGGAAGKTLGNILGKASASAENFGTKKAGQAMNLSPAELGNMTEPKFAEFQQFVKQQELLGKTPQEMLDNAKEVQKTFGDKLSEIRGQANELGLSTDIKPLTDALDAKFQAADALQNPDERKAASFYKRGIADILSMASQNPVAEGEAPTQITFDQLQRLKKSYGNSAFENGAVKNPAAADVYGAIKTGMQKIVDDAQVNKNLGQDYKDALKGYSQISPIVEGLEQRVGADRAGIDSGNATTNTVLGGTMVATGRGAFGARSLVRGLTGAAPETMARGANAVAGGLAATGAALPVAGAQITGAASPSPTDINTAHPALALWKPVFQKNAANAQDPGEVQKSQAVTDFILSQRDPAYAAAKQKASDEPFNTGMADQLKALREKPDAQSR